MLVMLIVEFSNLGVESSRFESSRVILADLVMEWSVFEGWNGNIAVEKYLSSYFG